MCYSLGFTNHGLVLTRHQRRLFAKVDKAVWHVPLDNKIRILIRMLLTTVSVISQQCTALLGQNGAGKSTTFSMLTGEVRPSSGQLYLNNELVNSTQLCKGLISKCIKIILFYCSKLLLKTDAVLFLSSDLVMVIFNYF